MMGIFQGWLCMVIGFSIYHGAKYFLGLDPDWKEFFSSAYWSAAPLLAIHFGMFKVKERVN